MADRSADAPPPPRAGTRALDPPPSRRARHPRPGVCQGELAGDASLSTVKKACSKLTKRAVRQQPVPNKENEHRECEAV